MEETVQLSTPNTTPKITAKDLVNQLRKGKRLYDEFGKELYTQYKINGKLLHEWKEYFKLYLPPDANTQTLREVDSRLMGLHQEASFFKGCCNAKLQAAKANNMDAYRQRYTELVAEYKSQGKKLPAKDTLSALAEHTTADWKNVTMHAEIEFDFWKEILNDLTNCRRLVENMTLNISVEAKALQNEKYIDAIASKRH